MLSEAYLVVVRCNVIAMGCCVANESGAEAIQHFSGFAIIKSIVPTVQFCYYALFFHLIIRQRGTCGPNKNSMCANTSFCRFFRSQAILCWNPIDDCSSRTNHLAYQRFEQLAEIAPNGWTADNSSCDSSCDISKKWKSPKVPVSGAKHFVSTLLLLLSTLGALGVYVDTIRQHL